MIHYKEWENGIFVTSVTPLSHKMKSHTSFVKPQETSTSVKNASTKEDRTRTIDLMGLDRPQFKAWISGYQQGTRQAKNSISEAILRIADQDSKSILEDLWQKVHRLEKSAHLEAPTLIETVNTSEPQSDDFPKTP